MSEQRKDDRRTGRAFLGRLARDKKANTMAIMAISVIPLAGMVGGGIDLARLYIVKTRLQHACDAGALAGRKAMGGGTWTYNNNYPKTQAESFFDANIQASPYGATGLTKAYSENAGKVSGTASATVPMTLMRVFLKTSETLTVTCDAEMRLPNTDVMFVLDTTGSMDDTPSGDSMTKMASLKSAVKCFYEIVARLNTDENCTTGTPSGGVGASTQVRFGFVPYATNVNVGKLLPTSYFADSWIYQTRKANYTTTTSYTYPNPATDSTGSNGSGNSSWSDPVVVSGASCWSPPSDQNNVTQSFSIDTEPTVDSNGVRTWATRTYTKVNVNYSTSWSGWSCTVTKSQQGTGSYTTVVHTQAGTPVTNYTFNNWTYAQLSQNIAGLKNGTSWNSSFTLPIGSNGADKTITWGGCVEERTTLPAASYDPIPSGAKDLNIDLVPTSGDPDSLWAPVLPDLIYTPSNNGNKVWTGKSGDSGYAPITTTTNYSNNSSYQCPTESRKLQEWDDAGVFDDYVDSLDPSGNTYHDIGLLWGARLLSPTGIFKTENEFTPQGGEIERHLIFMTDGDPCTGTMNLNAYGVAWYSRKQTPIGSAPTDGCTSTGTLTEQVNARTAALCTAIKNKNITLWVITFGTLAADTVTRMQACATTGRYFNATNAATIQSTFKSIADQISQLRLTK